MKNAAPSLRIERETRKIIVSKEFLINSSQYGTPEFKKRLELQAKYAGFTFETAKQSRNGQKQSGMKLTYKDMEDFMEGYETDSKTLAEVKKEYYDLRDGLKGSKGAYLLVKKWFLAKYEKEIERLRVEQEASKRAKEEANLIYKPSTITH